ncbi:TPA: putative 3',5'-cyclic phosphodiesterase pde-3 [Trebouxia sp. C0006]
MEGVGNASELRVSAMHELNPLHTFMFSSRGKLLNANTAALEACRYSGLTSSGAQGLTMKMLFDAGDYPGGEEEAEAAYDEALHAIFVLQLERHRHTQPYISKKDGRSKWAMIEMSPMLDPVDKKPAVLVQRYNITQQKQLELQLHLQQEALQRHNQELEQDALATEQEKAKLQQEADSLAEQLEAVLHDKFATTSTGFDADTPIDKTMKFLQSIIMGGVPKVQAALELYAILSESNIDLRQPVGLEEQLLKDDVLDSEVGQSMLQLLQGNAPVTVNKSAARRGSMEGVQTPSMLAGRAASGLLSQSASLVTSSESTASPGTATPSSGMVLQSPGPSPASQTAAAASPASTNRAPVGIASVLQRPAVVAATAASASGRLPEGSDNTAAAALVAPSEEAAAAASARGGVAQTRAVPLPSGPSGSPQGLTVSPVGTASSSSGTTGPSVGAAGSVAGTAGSGVGTAVVPVGQSEFLPHSVTPEVERWLQDADNNWAFDIFGYSDATPGYSLSLLVWHFVKQAGLIKEMSIDEGKFCAFARKIEAGYNPTNPYHNSVHVASVVQMTHMLMHHGGVLASQALTQRQQLATYFSALVHDFEHGGVNNDFLIKTSHPLAITYNDQSPLENHHHAAAVRVLIQPEHRYIPMSSQRLLEDQVEIRSMCISQVLGTDMKKHFDITSRFQAAFKRPGGNDSTTSQGAGPAAPRCGVDWDGVKAEDKTLVHQMVLKCADIGHLAAPPRTHRRWAFQLEEEFFRQGDKERACGMPVSPLMDRSTQGGMTRSQLGFFSIVGIPLFKAMVDLFADAKPMLDGVLANYAHWENNTDLADLP